MIVVRVKGGLGNQLFCYAAARRLALANGVELVIDDVSGFIRDHRYRRRYALSHFRIPVRTATPVERLEPFERYQRRVRKWLSHRRPFEQRRYLEQEQLDFDERLIKMKVTRTLYLDGYWQSEGYFRDVEQTIREDLLIDGPRDSINQKVALDIGNSNAVALHVRWFDRPASTIIHNISVDYYRRAVSVMEKLIDGPHYFVFSDNPEATKAVLGLRDWQATFVSHNRDDENSYMDLWLMSQCRHFITANSTFSWWGAWLGTAAEKIVLTPNPQPFGKGAWDIKGLIPNGWIKI